MSGYYTFCISQMNAYSISTLDVIPMKLDLNEFRKPFYLGYGNILDTYIKMEIYYAFFNGKEEVKQIKRLFCT